MQAPTKAHPTESVELTFRGPSARLGEALASLKGMGFEEVTIPWREMFPEISREEAPSVILRAFRKREGLTQKALSELTGIPQGHLSAMERGRIAIGPERARKLGKALNVGYKVFL